jgi:uncharacterized lipoprotein YbaY
MAPIARALAVMLAVASLAACAPGAGDARPEPRAAAVQKTPAAADTTVEGAIVVSRFEVPLPPGAWQVVYSAAEEVPVGRAWRTILIKTYGIAIHQAVLIYHVEIGFRQVFNPREACRHESYFFTVADEGGKGVGECRHVRAVSLGLGGAPGVVNQVFAALGERLGYFSPVTMIGSRYIRYKGPEQLQVDYLWTPDVLVPPPANTVWRPEDWSNDAVRRDARKLIVMRSLQRWNDDWYPKMTAAFPL